MKRKHDRRCANLHQNDTRAIEAMNNRNQCNQLAKFIGVFQWISTFMDSIKKNSVAATMAIEMIQNGTSTYRLPASTYGDTVALPGCP